MPCQEPSLPSGQAWQGNASHAFNAVEWNAGHAVQSADYETLAPNRMYTVSGAAWAGETDVTEIAVSTDGGQTWAEAEFLDPVRRHAWRRWKFDWLTPKEPGQYTLLARAKDTGGLIQPDSHDQNYGTYVINHSLPIEVFVDHFGGPRS